MKQGYNVTEHKDQTKMKTQFSNEHQLSVKSPLKSDIDARNAKQGNLQSSGGPAMFGNSSQTQLKFKSKM